MFYYSFSTKHSFTYCRETGDLLHLEIFLPDRRNCDFRRSPYARSHDPTICNTRRCKILASKVNQSVWAILSQLFKMVDIYSLRAAAILGSLGTWDHVAMISPHQLVMKITSFHWGSKFAVIDE